MPDLIPAEALQAAAWRLAVANVEGYVFDGDPRYEARREHWRRQAQTVISAAAPVLIAEGRRQAAAELREWCEDYRRGIGASKDPHDTAARLVLADMAREAARVAADGLSPAELADRKLRASRERQAGLDYDRIQRACARTKGPKDG